MKCWDCPLESELLVTDVRKESGMQIPLCRVHAAKRYHPHKILIDEFDIDDIKKDIADEHRRIA